MKKENASDSTMRMRKLTARMEKIEANAKKAEMRSIGQIKA
jgi:hypothetical protein